MSSSSAPAHLESATTPTVPPTLTPAVVVDDSVLPLSGKRLPDPYIGSCPSWCRMDHHFDHHADDRVHFSVSSCLPLELEMVSVERSNDGSADVYWPAVARVDIRQHYREVGPRICVSLNDDRGMNLTLTEASVLVELIQSKLGLAKGVAA